MCADGPPWGTGHNFPLVSALEASGGAPGPPATGPGRHREVSGGPLPLHFVAWCASLARLTHRARPGTPKERKFNGQDYLLSYGIPQFFFHVSTSYAILRHSGIEVGKRDYMGNY